MVAKENPHRKGSKAFERFKKMRDGLTVAAYVKKGESRSTLAHHVAKGYIKVA